jgi:hypothetical protein
MEITQKELTSKEWVIIAGGRTIPLSAIKAGIMVVMLFAIVGLAYNVGQNDAYQIVRISAYLNDNGVYDPVTGGYSKCYPEAEGNSVTWRCENATTESRYQPIHTVIN